jgi:hypothetical protein
MPTTVCTTVCTSDAENGDEGLEQGADSTENTHVPRGSGAESGAPGPQTSANDPQLAAVIDAWPRLSEPIKAGILAMSQVAGHVD